jgi:TPP-dependent pyruvate/acetoin dehydrogenase alpha subunit
VATLEEKGQVSSSGRLKEFLREMLLIRRFEEKVEERFRAASCPDSPCRDRPGGRCGGVCQALEENDVIASTHRAHGHTLAKGTHPNEVMAELYGKVEGMSHGYGGSMHLYDIERGNLGANAVVGGGLPGDRGLRARVQDARRAAVAVAFFGDGATNIGTFHESLNLAQLWTVPAVFVCENNHYAESTPAKQQLPIEDLTKRAEAFGMTAMKVDGQDVEAVYDVAKKALKHAREGRARCSSLPRHTASPATTSATRRCTGRRRRCASCARRRIRSRKRARSSSSPTPSGRRWTRRLSRSWRRLWSFSKQGTDPKPEDALKNVYS